MEAPIFYVKNLSRRFHGDRHCELWRFADYDACISLNKKVMAMSIVKKLLLSIDEIIAGFCGLTMVSITILGVIMRYVWNNPIKWMEEVCLGLFVWMVFLGASSGYKRDLHISITLLIELLPPRIQKFINFMVIVLTYVVLTVFTVLGYMYCTQSNVKITPALRLPYYYISAALPVGCVLMMIHISLGLLRSKICHKDLK
jgi:TRAP-type C4-dicarboxylate transport system permease small subunit